MPASTIGTTAQVAAALGVTPATIRNLADRWPGKITRYGTATRARYDARQVRDVLADRAARRLDRLSRPDARCDPLPPLSQMGRAAV